MIYAMILAGGQGIRFGATGATTRPKQFAEIHNKPIFIHTLQTYVELNNVGPVLLIANKDFIDASKAALRQFNLESVVKVVAGGDTRQKSVRNGLLALNDQFEIRDEDIIALHNAASPNTPADTITRCLEALEIADVDVAQGYFPELRTLFEIKNQRVAAVIPRPSVACACDPTIFRASALHRVVKRQEELGLAGDMTTDIALSMGMRIELIQSEHSNIKVTTRWDVDTLTAAMEEAGNN